MSFFSALPDGVTAFPAHGSDQREAYPLRPLPPLAWRYRDPLNSLLLVVAMTLAALALAAIVMWGSQ